MQAELGRRAARALMASAARTPRGVRAAARSAGSATAGATSAPGWRPAPSSLSSPVSHASNDSAAARCSGTASTSGRCSTTAAAAAPGRAAAAAAQAAGGSSTRTRTITRSSPGGSADGGGGGQDVRSAYIHLPFCKRKCFYCDFPVEAVGRDPAAPKVEARMAAYVDTLLREVAATRRLGSAPLESVFFGGGTPSLLPPALLGRILEALDDRFGIAAGAEVSLEADPGTFDLPRLRAYGRLGVSRLSVGVQAFQQELLTACGRGHDLAEAEAALEAVRAAGLRSWSLDLISGLPGLTPDMWAASLERAVAAGPDHVSVYDLQVEEGTPFERWQRAGRLRLPADEAAVEMYGTASRLLTAAGFEHYEVSNYAKPGHRCAHNQVYWRGLPYYAFGLGAASYLRGRRFSRPARMSAYSDWVAALADSEVGRAGAALPGGHLPEESQEELLLDTLMLALRTADGVDLARLRARHGAAAVGVVLRALRPHEQVGSAYAVDGAGRRISIAEAAVASSPILNPKAASAAAAAAAARGDEQGSAAQGAGEEELEARPGPAAGSAAALAAARERSQSGAQAPAEGSADGSAEAQAEGATGAVRVRLSDPDGFLLSNDVISDVFAAFDLPPSGLSDCEGDTEGEVSAGSGDKQPGGVERKPVAAA
ncbi:hypothetical protein HXX76_002890 [Chlamydomonas incerta]|uniref:Radical S-adenosyl methionine domain-containing protein 1, mitochondrial n=1 Tax=Chlamydomonas incerta TaxID=51695 RepID=A0A835W9W5_CHLIN|nr:hypothetical protein HXX76_002890 [Chlamydomonas incerta]|eukprot:KAG2442811.1 hypothetical protein HXX76_002890 [Chlamydomonas incerta]